ncbi:hypothetical protein EV702DRAFT_1244180 [Suillus placidus]|uniref:Uncharacterized protein n=1 Tax=Suillus placidus TaxID=48579 RepID=A0A9P6ZP18_9AGAM|nr:hypothetical protein EV702DRAFT_1244180 [Suillus placidus]
MGPPPLPSPLKCDTTRQLRPHISTGRPFARDPHQPLSASQHHFDSPTTTHGGNVIGQSPLLSTISVTSKTSASFATPTLSIEDVHKTAMHISAERAKQRRQVEEEEREKEKERAPQKAAALEEKCKPNEEKKNAQEAEAVKLIQEVAEAAKSPSQQALQLDATTQLPTPVKPIGRPPSLRASPCAPAPLLQGVEEFITVSADEDLEVVDFSDMGKLVGAPAAPQTEVSHKDNERPPRPPRPVASDFFEDSEPQTLPPRPKSPGMWRRKTPIELVREVLAPSSLTNQEVTKETGDKLLQDAPVSLPSPESIREAVPHISPSKSSSIADGSMTYSSNRTTLPTSPQRLICMPWHEGFSTKEMTNAITSVLISLGFSDYIDSLVV